MVAVADAATRSILFCDDALRVIECGLFEKMGILLPRRISANA